MPNQGCLRMNKWLPELTLALAILASAQPARSEFFVSGQFAAVARNKTDDWFNLSNAGYSPFDTFRARVFLDATITERLSGFVQIFMNSTSYNFSQYGAYIRYDHTPRVHLEAGLIPTPVGLWGQRTYDDKNPLVAVPAIFHYKTSLNPGALQSVEDLLAYRGTSEYTPIVYDFCWNTGVHAYATLGQVDCGVALTNGSLGQPARAIIYEYPNIAAHLSVTPAPELTVGIWGAMGPYLSPKLNGSLPDGNRLEDYQQLTGGGLVHASSGHWDAYAEALVNRFEHPTLGDLESVGGYVDVKYSLATWWYIAGRADFLTFSELADAEADGARWDYPMQRFEAGLGRRLNEKSRIKLVTQIVRFSDLPDGLDLDDEIVALQFSTDL